MTPLKPIYGVDAKATTERLTRRGSIPISSGAEAPAGARLD